MSKENILIIKSGLSGAKLNKLYSTNVVTDRGPVRLAGKTRLVGQWYRAAVAAAKAKGIKGTLSVIVHNEEDAEELIHEHQRLMIKLGKGVDWTPVARMRMSMNEFDDLSSECSNIAWNKLVEQNYVRMTKPHKYEYVNEPKTREEENAMRLYTKNFVASLTAEVIADKVEVI